MSMLSSWKIYLYKNGEQNEIDNRQPKIQIKIIYKAELE